MKRTAMLGAALIASLGISASISASIAGAPRSKPMQGRFIKPPPNRQPPLREDTWTARRKAKKANDQRAREIARNLAMMENRR